MSKLIGTWRRQFIGKPLAAVLNMVRQGRFWECHLASIAAIMLIGCLALTWFKESAFISHGDFDWPINPSRFFDLTMRVWDDTVGLGYPAPRQMASWFPFAVYGKLWDMLGMPAADFERLMFYIWFTGGGLSAYFLMTVLGAPQTARIAGSIFYMLNVYPMQVVWQVAHGLLAPAYAFLPLVLGLYIWYMRSPTLRRATIIGLILSLSSVTASQSNPALAVVLVAPPMPWMLLECLRRPGDAQFIIARSVALLILWLTLNLSWLLPFVAMLPQQYAAASNAPIGISDASTFVLNSVHLQDGLRLLGLWSVRGDYLGDPYVSWGPSFYASPMPQVAFVVAIVAWTTLVRQPVTPELAFFAWLSLAALTLVAGPYSPFGVVVTSAFHAMPALERAFRANFLKFGFWLPLGYAPLFGYGVLEFRRAAERCAGWGLNGKYQRVCGRAMVAAVLVTACGLVSFPFWNGTLIYHGGKNTPSAQVIPPGTYTDLNKWLMQQSDTFRIFVVPVPVTYNMAYLWPSGYIGANITRLLISKSIILSNFGGLDKEIIYNIGKSFDSPISDESVADQLGAINARYLLFSDDVDWSYISATPSGWYGHSRETVMARLNEDEGLTHVRDFGPLRLYQIDTAAERPRVYAMTGSSEVGEARDSGHVGAGRMVISESSAESLMAADLTDGTPRLQFVYEDATRVRVRVRGARVPFVLKFLDQFDPGWHVYKFPATPLEPAVGAWFDGRITEAPPRHQLLDVSLVTSLVRPSVPAVQHQVVDGFANAWRINYEGDYDLLILYTPQRLALAGMMVSVLALLFCLIYNIKQFCSIIYRYNIHG